VSTCGDPTTLDLLPALGNMPVSVAGLRAAIELDMRGPRPGESIFAETLEWMARRGDPDE